MSQAPCTGSCRTSFAFEAKPPRAPSDGFSVRGQSCLVNGPSCAFTPSSHPPVIHRKGFTHVDFLRIECLAYWPIVCSFLPRHCDRRFRGQFRRRWSLAWAARPESAANPENEGGNGLSPTRDPAGANRSCSQGTRVVPAIRRKRRWPPSWGRTVEVRQEGLRDSVRKGSQPPGRHRPSRQRPARLEIWWR